MKQPHYEIANMKRILIAAASLSTLAAPALATDVGVSISIGQPGFYGQIDIGGYPPPALIYREPVIVERVYVDRPPIYLHVPPGHAKNWKNYCHEYNACGQRVYFVKDDWYTREYVPRYQKRHGNPHDDGWNDKHQGGGPEGHGQGHGKGGHGKGKGD
jgi:hypothetical protein